MEGSTASLSHLQQRPTCQSHSDRREQEVATCTRYGEGQLLLPELDMDTAPGQIQDDPAQVIQVAGQPVHGMADQRVPFPDEGQQELELGSMNILAGRFIGKHFVEFKALKLAKFVLINSAYAQVSYLQALPCSSDRLLRRNRFFRLPHLVSENRNTDPINTEKCLIRRG